MQVSLLLYTIYEILDGEASLSAIQNYGQVTGSRIRLPFMYTGIVEQTGSIIALVDSSAGRRLDITYNQPMPDLKLGDSINISGCCFTVIDLAANVFVVQASHETLRRSKLGLLKINDKVNLERPLKLEDRLGGHLVSGHVDTVAKVDSIKEEGFSNLVTFALSLDYAPFFVEKGSVTVDGVSLTIVSTAEDSNRQTLKFSVALIPYTMEVTTLGQLKVSDTVNIETDLVSKYLARWLSLGNQISLQTIFATINSNAANSSTNTLVTKVSDEKLATKEACL